MAYHCPKAEQTYGVKTRADVQWSLESAYWRLRPHHAVRAEPKPIIAREAGNGNLDSSAFARPSAVLAQEPFLEGISFLFHMPTQTILSHL